SLRSRGFLISLATAKSIASLSKCGLMPASAGVLRCQSAPGNVCACAASGIASTLIRMAPNRICMVPPVVQWRHDSMTPTPAKCVRGACFIAPPGLFGSRETRALNEIAPALDLRRQEFLQLGRRRAVDRDGADPHDRVANVRRRSHRLELGVQ